MIGNVKVLKDISNIPFNKNYLREIKACGDQGSLGRTEAILQKYMVREEVVKEYQNGLVNVAIFDKDGLLLTVRTRSEV